MTKRDTLNDVEIEELVFLGKGIIGGLGCNANGEGLPCRSDRIASVRLMERYLEIHGYTVTKKGEEKDDEIKTMFEVWKKQKEGKTGVFSDEWMNTQRRNEEAWEKYNAE